jgi:hypothetical protein
MRLPDESVVFFNTFRQRLGLVPAFYSLKCYKPNALKISFI